MKTQTDTLRKEIKDLKVHLQHAVLNLDAFTQMSIAKRLDIAESTLMNILD
tara:strand:- start:410 stop:562 length:153 start_codon:yes stop_codon:yes gene_type:complete